ncbi:hypothetical protein NL676_020810 [Syzygium grande]|nr:hypothetical protein NL676_020810 [Syzygium grande]
MVREDNRQEFVQDNLVEMNDFVVFPYQTCGVPGLVLYGPPSRRRKEKEAKSGSTTATTMIRTTRRWRRTRSMKAREAVKKKKMIEIILVGNMELNTLTLPLHVLLLGSWNSGIGILELNTLR